MLGRLAHIGVLIVLLVVGVFVLDYINTQHTPASPNPVCVRLQQAGYSCQEIGHDGQHSYYTH